MSYNETSELGLGYNLTECRGIFELMQVSGDVSTNPLVITVFVCSYSILFVAGILGNLFVITAVARNPPLQSVRNMFIVNLSCSDLTVCFSSLLVTPLNALIKSWPLGPTLCAIIPWFQGTNLLISTFTLSCIAIDRYILILYPTNRPISKNQAICLIIFIWLLALISAFPVFQYSVYFELQVYIVEGVPYCGPMCSENWPHQWLQQTYGAVLLLMQFLLPMTLIAYCYSKILYALAHGVSSKMNRNKIQSARQLEASRKRLRTNRMLICMVVLFGCCWFPNILLRALLDFKLISLSTQVLFVLPLSMHCIAMTSVFWNPILYGWFNDQFRVAFLQFLPCVKKASRKASRTILKINDQGSAELRQTPLKTGNTELLQSNGVSHIEHQSKAEQIHKLERLDSNFEEGDCLL